jgi:hypothetical protein
MPWECSGSGRTYFLETGLLLLVVIAATPLLYPTVTEPSGQNVVFVLGIALTLGLLLAGVAALQVGVFPRGASILLLAATAGFFFVSFVAEFLPAMAGQLGAAFFRILLSAGLRMDRHRPLVAWLDHGDGGCPRAS